jgi:hypothetical protein
MSFVAVLLAPLALLLPAASGPLPLRDDAARIEAPPGHLAMPADVMLPALEASDMAVFQMIARSFHSDAQNQVRIEQRVTIRITPLQAAPSATQSNMLMDLPQRPMPRRITERDFGRCLPINGIAGVEVSPDNRLILYMRDRRVLSAGLERSCSARDYYSGFYVERNADGQICVKRDNLMSRSGANCKLSRIRQLVEAGN